MFLVASVIGRSPRESDPEDKMTTGAITTQVPLASDEQKKIVEWIRAEHAVASRERDKFSHIHEQCLRAWEGDQYTEYVLGPGQRWERRQVKPQGGYSVRKVDNQLLSLCRWALSRAAQSLPNVQLTPEDESPEKKQRAAYGNKILRAYQKTTDEPALREQELLWLVGVGEVLRRSSWDPDGGDPGNPQGDLLSEIVNVFLYMKDPYSIGKWPPTYIIEEDVRHVDWIKDRYGIKVDSVSVTDATRRLDTIATAGSQGGGGGRVPMKDAAILTRLTVPRSKKHPGGRCWIICGDKLLDEYRLQAGVFPYSLATWYPVAGRLYPISLIESVLSGQMELNHLVSLLYEAAIGAVRGDMITAGMNTDIRIKEYDEKTGAKQIELGPGVEKFERVQLAADWAQAEQRRQVIERGMKEKAGTSEPSMGQPVEKQTTAYEIQVVREANVQGVQWHLERYANRHLTTIAMQELQLLQRYVVAPRTVQSPKGQGIPPEVITFVGADLEGAGDVEAVALPYMSPAMRQQAQYQAWQAKMSGPWETVEEEWAARMALRRMGLEEVEAEIGTVYGPLEELEPKVQEMKALREQAEAAELQARIAVAEATALQAQNPQPNPGEGQPGGTPEVPPSPQEQMLAALLQ